MTLTITIDDKYKPAFLRRTTGEDTAESIAAAAVVESMETFLAIDLADQKAALAANERLMALGAAVAAQPEKLDAVEAVVNSILTNA